jgi:uncharacterized protein (UPF0332 family)
MNWEEVQILVAARMEQAGTALADARFLETHGRSSQSVVNRVYYAMFYGALALLQTIGQTPSGHGGVLALFDREFVLPGLLPKRLSKDLHWAFDTRQASDYRALQSISSEEARKALATAEAFLAALREYLAKAGWLSLSRES